MMWRLAIVLGLIMLPGCQKFLEIQVVDEHSLQPIFRFHYALSVKTPSRSEEVNLRTFTVYRTVGNASEDIMWEIEAYWVRPVEKPVTKPAPLKMVKYGVALDGFRTVVPAQPLAWNDTYRSMASLSMVEDQAVVGAGGEFKPTPP